MNTGVVVIGRNEGSRLVACLKSASDYPTVYVDSGSTDDSVESAKALGADVVSLDMSVPFTAARGRNEGFAYLMSKYPELEYVQFVDGDCELVQGWIEFGVDFLQNNKEYAVVCGRRAERYPNASIYNLLCDIEWDSPIGDAAACGGDAIYRSDVLQQVQGFDPGFIAGEEPELCFRIRTEGYKIRRIQADMTLHDANMHHFKQWWKRSLRSGYAYALNYTKHGHVQPERFKFKELKSIVVWTSLALISLILSVLALNPIFILLFLALLGLQTFRIGLRNRALVQRNGKKVSLIYAFSTMFAKLPQMIGVIQFLNKQRRGRQHTLVEYK